MFLFRIVDAQAEEDLWRLRLGQPVRPLQAGGAQDGGGDAQGGAIQGGRHIRRVSEIINCLKTSCKRAVFKSLFLKGPHICETLPGRNFSFILTVFGSVLYPSRYFPILGTISLIHGSVLTASFRPTLWNGRFGYPKLSPKRSRQNKKEGL